ncbi:MAG: hypothetical protein ACXWPM_02395 [Bdellovibrionota bacterium]
MKRLISAKKVLGLLGLALVTLTAAKPVQAFMAVQNWGGGGYGYGPQLNPFVQTPFFPGQMAVNPYATGQMGGSGLTYADYVALSYSNTLNWAGSQPFGIGSYLPPIGLSSISNTMTFDSTFRGI